jgi:hypothetical protein
MVDHTHFHVATDSEADEIVTKATQFCDLVERWISSKVANLKR